MTDHDETPKRNDDRVLDPDDTDRVRLRLGYVADQFFVDELPPQHQAAPAPPMTIKRELRALATFNRALAQMDPNGRSAAIGWLRAKWIDYKAER